MAKRKRAPGRRSAAWRAAETQARAGWERFRRDSEMGILIPEWREIAPIARERMVRRVLEMRTWPLVVSRG